MAGGPQGIEILDQKVLGQLRTFARSASFIPQLINVFEEHGRRSLFELKAAFEAEDYESMQKTAHRLKGSCLNVGALALSRQLRELEELLTEGRALSPETLAVIDALFSTTCLELRAAQR